MLKEALSSVLNEGLPSEFEKEIKKLVTNTRWERLGLIITIVVGLIQIFLWFRATRRIFDQLGRVRVRGAAAEGDGLFLIRP